MKRIFPLLLVLSLFSTVFAVDLKGKIGLGTGWVIPPPVDEYGYSVSLLTPTLIATKVGIASRLAIEPTFQFTSISNDEKASLFTLCGLVNYLFLGHKKTNIYLKGGFAFTTASVGGTTVFSQFGLPIGVGLEHWVSEHFSIELSPIGGFFIQNEPFDATIFSLGNATLNLALIWYY